MPSVLRRSITLRRTYSLGVIRFLAAARDIAGGSEAGQRIRTRSVNSVWSMLVDFRRAVDMVGSIQAASNQRTQSAKGVRLAAIERRKGGATKSASRNNIASIARHTKGPWSTYQRGMVLLETPTQLVLPAMRPTETPQQPREQTCTNVHEQKR